MKHNGENSFWRILDGEVKIRENKLLEMKHFYRKRKAREFGVGVMYLKKIYLIASIVMFLLAVYFGGMAYKQYLTGNLDYNLDKVYINVGYCALFLSIAVYVLHLREHKS